MNATNMTGLLILCEFSVGWIKNRVRRLWCQGHTLAGLELDPTSFAHVRNKFLSM